MAVSERSQALFIGGRSGSGKTSVGYEIHAQLSASRVRHALLDGDNLDMAYPLPHEHSLAEQNLAAIWANYRSLGYRRLVYVNTASVFRKVNDSLKTAMGDDPEVTAVLLTCSDAIAHQRLGRREIGTGLAWHLERSTLMAHRLERQAPSWVHRVPTDDRSVRELAADIICLTAWAGPAISE